MSAVVLGGSAGSKNQSPPSFFQRNFSLILICPANPAAMISRLMVTTAERPPSSNFAETMLKAAIRVLGDRAVSTESLELGRMNSLAFLF